MYWLPTQISGQEHHHFPLDVRRSSTLTLGTHSKYTNVEALENFGTANSATAPPTRDFEALQLPLDERVLAVAFHNLVYKSNFEDDRGSLVINFATLQRMRLHKLQAEIVNHILDIRYHGLSDSCWEVPLREYGACLCMSPVLSKC